MLVYLSECMLRTLFFQLTVKLTCHSENPKHLVIGK